MSKCDNCGKNRNSKKPEEECQFCGYIKPKRTELEPATLIYCRACGHHCLDACKDSTHKDSWEKVKLCPIPEKKEASE